MKYRFVRSLFIAILAQVAMVAQAQGPAPERAGQNSADAAAFLAFEEAPQAVVMVRKQPNGADVVEITVVAPGYDPKLLASQCQMIGELTGDPVRGLSVGVTGSGEGIPGFVKAKFGTLGIIDTVTNTFNLEPLMKGLSYPKGGSPIRSVHIIFQNTKPNQKTLRTYASDAVVLAAQIGIDPPSVEYRVRRLTDDPEAIKIPREWKPESSEPNSAKSRQESKPTLLIVLLLIFGSIAIGALVYFVASGGGKATPRSSQ